ncbi:MAG: hypothetical protein MJA28_16545 [Gammaproteobacteria bacterium]|nr:hypothetical protein [Gammaproteobacteria bacterium]
MKRSNRYLTFVFTAFIAILASCGSESTREEASTVSESALSPDCFIEHPENPIITSGDFSAELSLTQSTWNDPHVIKEGNTYYMYASSDDHFNHDIKIYRLSSMDGIQWQPDPAHPVLGKSPGEWDSQSTETPAVIKLADTYHMFWTGYADYTNVTDFKIGHATSLDGVTWVKDENFLIGPSAPHADPNFEFDQYVVAEPAPVVFNGMIYLYFSALGINAELGKTQQVIGVITSSDGIHWTAPQPAIIPDQSLYPRESPEYYKGYSTPHALVLDQQIHLFFDVIRTNEADTLFSQQKIHHAVSANGINGWQQDEKAIIDYRDAAWTEDEVRSPAAYLEGDQLLLWYAGHSLSPVSLGIGLATCLR